jgi:3-oxoacyl-[acyl-carrier protein] reductase
VAGDGARVAIVTGGAGGLGRAIARRLRSDGFRVAAADLSTPAGDEAAGEMTVRVDVTEPESAEAMCAQVHGRWGRIDVLVNNAGIAGPTLPVTQYPPEAWSRVIAVNLGGVFHCTRSCLPCMIAAGYGRIVNIASIGRTGVLAGLGALLVQHRRRVRPLRRPSRVLIATPPITQCRLVVVSPAGLPRRLFAGVPAAARAPGPVTTTRQNGHIPTFRPGTTPTTAAAAALSRDQGYPRAHTARHQP